MGFWRSARIASIGRGPLGAEAVPFVDGDEEAEDCDCCSAISSWRIDSTLVCDGRPQGRCQRNLSVSCERRVLNRCL